MPEVIVAIPTFRRPQSLQRLLNALAVLETEASVSVLVADNDADGREGLKVCERQQAAGYRWPLEYFVAEERGISQVRNALVNRILSRTCDFVAMLDDDEWPETGWLDAFLELQVQTRADALHGAILRDFDSAPGAWAAQCDGVSPLHGKTGPVPMIEGSGNILVSRDCFEGLRKPCFDPAFALTGGEDRDFFERLRRQGRRFVWCDEAVVHAHVPPSRANLRWALSRAYRVGNSDMRVFLKYRPSMFAKSREAVKIAAALLLFPLLFVILGLTSNRPVNALRKVCRAAGKIAAIRGRYYNEYAETHGR